MLEQPELQEKESREKNANAPTALTTASKPTTNQTTKTRKKKTIHKKNIIKITKFDKALAEHIISGETSLKKIQEKMRVDEKEFFERAKKLGDAGYIVTNEAGETRFGIKGFEAFANQFKKHSLSLKPREQPEETQATQAQQTRQTQANPIQQTVPPALDPKQTFLSTTNEKNDVDLSELLKKGAPKPGDSFFVKRQHEKSARVLSRAFETSKPKSPTKISTVGELVELVDKKSFENTSGTGGREALMVDGSEACELCKTKFKLAVAGGNPKYGHCFCGAAYHKDCYETLVDNGGKCVRCGKKLKLELSKQSEEAVKEIKEVF